MPFSMPNYPLLNAEQTNPFANLITNALNTYQSGIKSKFMQPMMEQDLKKAVLENQWNPKIWQSEIGLRGAQAGHLGTQTDLDRLKLKYPGLGEGGIVGELAFANLLRDRPEIAKRFSNIGGMPQENIQNQLQQQQQPESQELNIPGHGGMSANPNSDLIQSMLPVIAKNQGQQKTHPTSSQQQSFDPAELIIQNIQSEMNARNALANYRSGGGFSNMRYAPAIQKNISAFSQQLAADHPDWNTDMVNQAQNAYLTGADEVNGTKLPELSGTSSALRAAIFKQNSTTQIQNQAAALDATAQDFNSIDLEPLAKFAGISGKLNILKYKAMMASGQEVPQDVRDYLSYQDNISNFAMDTLRKGFGTSVVPGYVYATLGNAANPGSQWWSDPKQVYNDMRKVKEWLNKNADIYKAKAQLGATAQLSNNVKNNSSTPDLSNMTDDELKKIAGGK